MTDDANKKPSILETRAEASELLEDTFELLSILLRSCRENGRWQEAKEFEEMQRGIARNIALLRRKE